MSVSFFAFQDVITSVTGVLLLIAMLMVLRITATPKFQEEQPDNHTSVTQQQLEERMGEAARVRETLISQISQTDKVFDGVTESAGVDNNASLQAALEQRRLLLEETTRLKERLRLDTVALDGAMAGADAVAEEGEKAKANRREAERLRRETSEIRASNRRVYNTHNTPPDSDRRLVLVELFEEGVLASDPSQEKDPEAFRHPGGIPGILKSRWAFGDSARFVIFVRPGTTGTFKELHEGLLARGHAIGFDVIPTNQTVIGPFPEIAP